MANPKWVRGQSGNPGGRRKQDYTMRDLALAKCPWALKRLEQIAKQSVDLRAAYQATMGILAYGVGKPLQPIDLSNTDGTLAEMFKSAVRSANGMTPEAPEEPGVDRSTH